MTASKPLPRTRIQLTAAQIASLRPVIDIENYGDPVDIYRLEQPWFHRHLIVEVYVSAHHPRRFYVGFDPSDQALTLTRNLPNLQRIAAAEPVSGLDDADEAHRYATTASFWTFEFEGEFRLDSFDDLPLVAYSRAPIEALRDRFGEAIQPETRERVDGGWRFRSWWLSMYRLVMRDLFVPPGGRLQRTETIHAEGLPVPDGRDWQLVNGRYIPA